MKTLKEMVSDAVKLYFEPIASIFKSPEPCQCPYYKNEHDPLAGKLFKHYNNGKLYRYLFPVTCKDTEKEDLMVVYQDIESGKKYSRKWNYFFSSTKVNGKEVPRFEEQE